MASWLKKKMMRIMQKMMITCEKASYLVSKSQDEKLSCIETVNMRIHMAGCKFCRRYKKDIRIMEEKIRNYRKIPEDEVVHIYLSPEQKKRLQDTINSTYHQN